MYSVFLNLNMKMVVKLLITLIIFRSAGKNESIVQATKTIISLKNVR